MAVPVLRHGRPIWFRIDRRQNIPRFPSLQGHHDVEVAIVGGGMTGAMIASHFAKAGVNVAVIEAQRAGAGSTAASTALLLQEPDLDLTSLAKRYGDKKSRRIWELSFTAARNLAHSFRDQGVACDLLYRDSVYYTKSVERARLLQRELAKRHQAGLPGEWLSPKRVRDLTGLTAAGAVRTRGNAQLNPYRACLGLIKAAARAGAGIYEQSRVRRIQQRKHGVRLHTTRGSVDAAQVIIATGYATREFRPLAGRFRMRHTFVVATNPLTRAERRDLGLGDVMLWDTERPYHYVRWTPDHRLLLGGADRRVRPGMPLDRAFREGAADLRGYFEMHLPTLANVGFDYAWEGMFAVTPDSLPYIGPHRRYPRHTFALGYGGNGMTFAWMAAHILLEQWKGISSSDHQLFSFNRGR
jgi:glycine/D-amino acid oxidase-like deaminating enzyme